jgi:hypothetical protein
MESPIVIDSCDVEFVCSKVNDYKETIFFFKLIDAKLQKKLKPFRTLGKLENGDKLPYWVADNGEHIMKVKSKYVPKKESLVKGGRYNAKLEFVYYDMVEKGIKGYYSKIGEFKPRVIEVDSD